MTVRPKIIPALALALVLCAGGCGGGEKAPMVAETDDSGFRLGQQLVRQGRDAEALTTFLKVIERRGEQASAESHLEAGLIYLRHAKNPIYAIYHFQKYLELEPNTKLAGQVRGQIDTARREYARTLPGRPLDSQVTTIDQSEQIQQLERQIEDLKAENAVLRSLAPAPSPRVSRTTIDVSDPTPVAPPVPPSAGPATIRLGVGEPTRAPVITTPQKPAVVTAQPPGKMGSAKAPAGRKHTVQPHETLYAIAKKYGVTVEAIVAANPQTLPNVNASLRAGAELKIP